jgi:hypothetical protein
MGKRETQIILKTEERDICLNSGTRGIWPPKSSCWDKTVFPESHKFEIAVKNGRWVLTHLPAGPRPAVEPVLGDPL